MTQAIIGLNGAEVTPTSEYDFDLPIKLMPGGPWGTRGRARLMVVWRVSGRIEHGEFRDIPQLLRGREVFVNNSRLLPHWIGLWRMPGYQVRAFLIRNLEKNRWLAYMQARSGADRCEFFTFGGSRVRVESTGRLHRWILDFSSPIDLARDGRYMIPPLPDLRSEIPKESLAQTLYAKIPGSFAAPTAGIHFTEELLAQLEVHELTLHTAPGTFYDVPENNPGDHPLEPEYYEIPRAPQPDALPIAVGTTTTKALEAWARTGELKGWSSLFIYPPFKFSAVGGLLTNFHLPKQTLLMLTCAFGGYELVMEAHREAVREGYRFSYYGDLLLIL